MSGQPIWPRIAPGFVRAMLAGHSALGLAFAALIWLVCFTGSVAVFTQEFARWEQPVAPLTETVTPEAANIAFQAGMKKMPWAENVYVGLPTKALPRLTVEASTHAPDEREALWLADSKGNLLQQAHDRWSEFQGRLHFELHLPRPWGGYLIGLVGVALLSSIISGVLSHPRAFKDAFSLRLGGAKRLQEADLHNRIGMWGLPFYLVVSLTGAFLGLTALIVGVLALAVFKGDVKQAYALFLGPTPIDNPAASPPPDLTTLFAYVKRDAPKAHVDYVVVEHPFEKGARIVLSASSPGKISRGESYVFGSDGRSLGVLGYEKGTLGQKILSGVAPIHFGWFGGPVVKCIYAILGMGLASITSSGVAIWMARRRDKGKPAEIWERLWAAFIWSQPIAYAVTAGTALLAPPDAADKLLLYVWGGTTFAAVLLPAVMGAKLISTILRTLGGIALLVLVGVHMWRFGLVPADPVALAVNGFVVLTAIGLILSTIWRPHLKPQL
ncbi:PepSY-associated TM helix domain-containing protein [Asticcacaulis sp. 201]|uniref:PepSY-associated TM helix domain-containing protein n=1 Tax=Asticcacaulis sp. 201 TaxID=3028787 RepID=UPI0029163746|nr:PepSY-associated TM helix domain-containing protein [Asticcacaulis sp. 201]MDV6332762.1 PepSY-associated TM helix domain-containing protein [Asticcacaulis sp. 201]